MEPSDPHGTELGVQEIVAELALAVLGDEARRLGRGSSAARARRSPSGWKHLATDAGSPTDGRAVTSPTSTCLYANVLTGSRRRGYPSIVRTWLAGRRRFIVGMLVVAAVCLGIAEESFAHTDDGCPVEIHCIACRLATGTIAITAVRALVIVRTFDRFEPIWTAGVQMQSQAVAAGTPSRAPPFA